MKTTLHLNRPKGGSRVAATYAAVSVALVILFGPRVVVNETTEPVVVPDDVSAWLDESEAQVSGLREGEGKEVVWFDSVGARTARSVVYVHGFSADRHELDPIPQVLADSLGANLFFTRLTGHGRDNDAMGEATVQDWFQDIAEAVAVGRRLGDEVILLGTSTGGTYRSSTTKSGSPGAISISRPPSTSVAGPRVGGVSEK